MGYSAACLDGDPDDPHALAYASKAILGAGVAAVLCKSRNFTFLRNSIEHGLRGLLNTHISEDKWQRSTRKLSSVNYTTTATRIRTPIKLTFPAHYHYLRSGKVRSVALHSMLYRMSSTTEFLAHVGSHPRLYPHLLSFRVNARR